MNESHTPFPLTPAGKFLKDDKTWVSGTGGAAWGDISGTLSAQTDLNSALSVKTTLTAVKADADVSSAISLKHSNTLDHSNAADHGHSNKSTLDTYDQSNANISDAVTKKHANTLDHNGGTQDTALTTHGNLTSTAHGGIPVAHSRANGLPVYAALANDTLAQNYAVNSATKLTVTANRTLTTTVPPAGCTASTIILTSGGSSFTITFGSGFKPTGTLATGTTSARVFIVNWISDGTNLYEAGRTAAMVA